MSTLRVKVVAGSSSSEVVGWLGDVLKIRVTPRPEKGRANEALVSLLAEVLGIPKKDVNISSGASSLQKVIKINNLSDSELRSRLARLDAGQRPTVTSCEESS
jgi:uncharacterized protein (TIGR00251 family)